MLANIAKINPLSSCLEGLNSLTSSSLNSYFGNFLTIIVSVICVKIIENKSIATTINRIKQKLLIEKVESNIFALNVVKLDKEESILVKNKDKPYPDVNAA